MRAGDGKQFYCHSFVIDAWAPDLLKDHDKKRGFEINVDGFSNDAVHGRLTLMYGGTLDQLPASLWFETTKLAESYCDALHIFWSVLMFPDPQ